MALKKTASGKVDKRTLGYKQLCANARKARLARKRSVLKKSGKTARRQDGHLDQRTKAGKAAAARMAKARAARGKGFLWKMFH